MHGRTWNIRLAISACLALLVAACGGEGATAPGQIGSGQAVPGVHAVLGAGVTDTIDAKLSQALVIEVRGPDGQPASGAVVRLEAEPPTDTIHRHDAAISMCPIVQPTCGDPTRLPGSSAGFQLLVDTTDSHGRAQVILQLGHAVGPAVILLSVPALGLEDSVRYTVLPGAPAHVRALVADTTLSIGATASLGGHVVDRYNNIRTETPSYAHSPSNALTVDAATGTVTGRDMGTEWLYMNFLSAASDSTEVTVVPQGRLVVWSSVERAVRLVNLDGSAVRTLVTGVASDQGAFPRFDGTRQHVTLHSGPTASGGSPNTVIVIDTTGTPRRDIGPSAGFATVIATRQLADGTLLVVGRTVADTPCVDFALYRIATDDSLTCETRLPGLVDTYGGADISHDGARVAYVGSDASIPNSSPFVLRVLDVATGTRTVLEPVATAPRWSSLDDRVAYLVPSPGAYVSGSIDGTATIINADGTGRQSFGSFVFDPGLAWSPDDTYIVGRNRGSPDIALRVIRLSDGSDVLLRFRTATATTADYYQPDWR